MIRRVYLYVCPSRKIPVCSPACAAHEAHSFSAWSGPAACLFFQHSSSKQSSCSMAVERGLCSRDSHLSSTSVHMGGSTSAQNTVRASGDLLVPFPRIVPSSNDQATQDEPERTEPERRRGDWYISYLRLKTTL